MIRSLRIVPVLNGFIVEVGCQKLVFTTLSELTDRIKSYYRDPEIIEKMYLEDSENSQHFRIPVEPAIRRGATEVGAMAQDLNVKTPVPRPPSLELSEDVPF